MCVKVQKDIEMSSAETITEKLLHTESLDNSKVESNFVSCLL